MNLIQQALGDEWDKLPSVIKRHYTPKGKMKLTGQMDEVWHSKIAGIFIFFSRFLNALIPYTGKDIPTVAYNWISEDSKSYHFLRQLKFPGKNLIEFPSQVVFHKDNQVIEYVKLGLGLRMALTVENENLVFTILSYVQNLGLFKVYIPNFLVLGGGKIVEKKIDEETIRVEFELKHPLFGKTFMYEGNFKLSEE